MLTSSVRNTANRPRPVNRPGTIARRYLVSAFFYACVLVASAPLVAATSCDSLEFDEKVTVKYVIDGDTVVLDSGVKLRLIGLDTPELGRDGKDDQPYARDARNALDRLIKDSRSIGLIHDAEKTDRYGRRLAHAFTRSGENIQARLLASGLATPMVLPPSILFAECYAQQSASAMQDKAGLWSLDRYRLIRLPADTAYRAGFNRIEGDISSIREHKGWLLIRLNKRLRLSIPPERQQDFSSVRKQLQKGARIKIQGWLSPYRGELSMMLHHPAQLIIYN